MVVKEMETAEFKEEYKEAKTWGDCDRLLEKLTKAQLISFVKAHEVVKELTGLDMRQEWYVGSAKAILVIQHNVPREELFVEA